MRGAGRVRHGRTDSRNPDPGTGSSDRPGDGVGDWCAGRIPDLSGRHHPRTLASAFRRDASGKDAWNMSTILLIILILLLIGALPTWPHSRTWGYAPSGGLGAILIILLILILLNQI